jgi:hypothetical protein
MKPSEWILKRCQERVDLMQAQDPSRQVGSTPIEEILEYLDLYGAEPKEE